MNNIFKLFSFYFAWRFLTLFFAQVASYFIPFRQQFSSGKFGQFLPYLVQVWAHFDAYHYMEIAERGYQQFEQPFFPFYPLVISLLSYSFDLPFLFSGQLISNVCFILALVLMYKLLILDKKEKLSNLFYLSLILFPTSMFYGAVYNDSIFLFLACLTLYFGRKQKWILASLTGALASLTRLNGLALFFFLLFEYLDLENIKKNLSLKKIWKSKIFFIILIPIAFLGYYAFTQIDFGGNILFSSMKIWRQERPVFPLQVFWRYLKIFFLGNPKEFVYWVATVEFLFVSFYLYILIFSFNKIRRSYWIFIAISLLIPSLTGTFAGMPRYSLHLYPFFLALALLLDKGRLPFKIIYFGISIILMFYFIGFFTRGYFVS